MTRKEFATTIFFLELYKEVVIEEEMLTMKITTISTNKLSLSLVIFKLEFVRKNTLVFIAI